MRILNYFKALVLVLFALLATNMSAGNVDALTAQAKAIQFMNAQPDSRFMASSANMKLTYTEHSSVNAKWADFYVFNLEGGGFVIVAGEDRAEEILGYGDYSLDMNVIPDNMRWWLNQYKRQIEFLHQNPTLEVTTPSQLNAGMLTLSVAPLLTCQWDQESPYWNQCPTYGGSRCLTGCIATAMAQVMYKWKYPAQLPAVSAYTTRTRHITVAALPGTTVDWASMTDTYNSSSSTAAKNAVATLMRYCGQASLMDYDNANNGGSGAYCEDQLAGMKLFGYNSGATCIDRDDYSATQWNAKMQEDLAAGRPILYAGDDSWAGGHAFVVDGYNGSKYHINWGWSGDGDNYFALDAFSVSGYTFKYYQQMLYQIYPEGSLLETYAPVMGEATNVGTTSFKAVWTDETPSENVTDYTLYVTQYDPNSVPLLTETFGGVTATIDGSTRIESTLDTYCDNAGWTGSYVYQAGGGGIKLGNASNGGTLTSPALNLSNSGGNITVSFKAKKFGSDATSLTISCGNASQTVTLTENADDYNVVLSGVTAATGQNVTFSSTGSRQRYYLYRVEIMTGGIAKIGASESGDASSRVITGITAKNYMVNNLNPGGSYRFYVEANYTDGMSEQSNVETVTLEGSSTPVPTVIVDEESLTMNTNVGETVTATFNVSASDLTGNVALTLNDASGMFSITPMTISKAAAEAGAAVTVTYNPTAPGNHSATVTLSSAGAESVAVTINGTAAMQTTAPVMAEATNVETTSFTATWTDATPAAFVMDYTLYVNRVADGPSGSLLLVENFGGVTATNDGTAHIENNLDTYCDNAGWTGLNVYQAGGGGVKLGNSSSGGYLTTPALDLSNSGGTVTVVLNAKTWGTDATTLTVSCGDVSETVTLTTTAADYTVTLNGVSAAANQQVTIASNGSKQRFYLYSVSVYNGTAAKAVSETGNENNRVITGITAKTYTVESLTPGATYNFYVVANYIDDTNANSNIEQVTLESLPVVPTPELVVDPESLTMSANLGETVTATFDVLGTDLTGPVTITLTDESGMFTVTPATISIDDAEAGATVTVTYAPNAAGNHTATVTVASEGAEDVAVTINATAVLETFAPEMQPADEAYVTTTSFRADWVDLTPEEYVKDYTLFVNIEQDTPVGALILNETFYSEDVPTSDSSIDEGANGTLDDCCDNAGWTGYGVYLAGGGGMKLGAGKKQGYLTSPALDLTNSNGKAVVKFCAKSYGTDGSSVIVSCGEVSETVELTEEAADYTVVLDGVTAAEGQYVTLSCTAAGKRFYLYSVQIYSGEADRAVSETGDENSRIITGITDKYYVVEDLTPGATYNYYVEANYIDDTMSDSNYETVTLLTEAGHDFAIGDVNHDGEVDINDVTLLIDYLMGTGIEVCEECANVNNDNEIDISDVTTLIDMLLN